MRFFRSASQLFNNSKFHLLASLPKGLFLPLLAVSICYLTSCESNMHIKELKNEKDVVLILKELKTDDIPSEIGLLTQAETLRIQEERTEGWVVYPPTAAYETRELKPPFRTIPNEIAQLKNLKSLDLTDMDIHELPTSLSALEQLEYLNLSMNKLDVTEQLPVLKSLKNLKHLVIWGNHYDEDAMQKFQAEFPGLKLEYKNKDTSS